MIRVLSDLHFAHPASLVQNMRQIEPLLDGVETVIFNGDTVELRTKSLRSKSESYLEQIQSLCLARGIKPVVINGNHDPDASQLDHFDLMDGRLLVTHGHVFFPEITPWGREAKRYRENHRLALKKISPDGRAQLEDRLQAVREACLRTLPGGRGIPETSRQWIVAALSEMSHPLRAWEVLRAWFTCPGLVAAYAADHRPRAQGVIMGHTHLPGWWTRGGRLVVNTGAYLPWFGRRMVDVSEASLRVRAVERDGKFFRPGKELFRWSPKAEEPAVEVPQVVLPYRGEVQ